MPRHGGKRKKTRTHTGVDDKRVSHDIPKSFVIKRGKTVKSVSRLVKEIRQLMLPWTAKHLKERKDNSIKDFVSVAGPLGITHMFLVSQRSNHVLLRLAKLPGGATLSFEIDKYSLMPDVRAEQEKPRSSASDFIRSPLVVLNGFRTKAKPEVKEEFPPLVDARAVELMRTLFSSLFPSIDIRDIKLDSASKRVVLFDHLGDGKVEVRQYAIVRSLAGVSPAVAQLYAQSRNAGTRKLDSEEMQQLAELVKREAADDQESTAETHTADAPKNVIRLPTKMLKPSTRENRKQQQQQKTEVKKGKDEDEEEANTASQVGIQISLVELGPRLTMRLVKVETGVCAGEVIWEAPSHVKVHEDLME